MSLWKEATPEETDKIIEKIAKKVVDRELDIPAIFFLGTFRPVSYFGGQMFRFFLAAFTPILGNLPYEYIYVFEQSENILRLIRRIDELREERSSKHENKVNDKSKELETK
jgi:hypothetical protein